MCIDVGIKNLAFCILNQEQIFQWKLINLLDTKTPEKCDKCKRMGKKYAQDNLWYCGIHSRKVTEKLTEFKSVNSKNVNHQKLCCKIIECINNILNDLNCDLNYIGIELQLKCNPKMKFASHVIYTLLVEKFNNTIPIKFIRAANKLKLNKDLENSLTEKCALKSKYQQRKWKAIEYTKILLQKYPEDNLNYLLTHKKQCDLADTFLMCYNLIKLDT